MIDTIVLRIHRIYKYEQLIESLKSYNHGKDFQTVVVKDGGEVVSGADAVKKKIDGVRSQVEADKIYTMVTYLDTDNFSFLSHRGYRPSTSSHYNIAYVLDIEKGYCEVNFSLPKFLYGSNVMQSIDYYDTSPKRMWTFFNEKLNDFLRWFSPLHIIQRADVEINRIDFCFNQFFVNKTDALNYLELQKTAMMRLAASQKNRYRSYEGEALEYITRRYKFKVYHKGTEFVKNDLKEIQKSKSKKVNVQLISEAAERILRYETTYRNSYMNYFFQQAYCNRTELNLKGVYRYLFGVLKIQEKFVKKTFKFFLESNYDDLKGADIKPLKKSMFEELRDNNEVTFTYNLFLNMYKEFWQKIQEIQVAGNSDLFYIEKQFKAYNEKIKAKNLLDRYAFESAQKLLPKEKQKTFKEAKLRQQSERNVSRLMHYYKLSQKEDLINLVHSGVLSESQFYEIKKFFAQFKIGTFNPDTQLRKPPVDYLEYKSLFGRYH